MAENDPKLRESDTSCAFSGEPAMPARSRSSELSGDPSTTNTASKIMAPRDVHLAKALEQGRDRVPVPVDRDHDGVADQGRHRGLDRDWASKVHTLSISSSVSSGKQGSVTISAAARSVSVRSVTRTGAASPS